MTAYSETTLKSGLLPGWPQLAQDHRVAVDHPCFHDQFRVVCPEPSAQVVTTPHGRSIRRTMPRRYGFRSSLLGAEGCRLCGRREVADRFFMPEALMPASLTPVFGGFAF